MIDTRPITYVRFMKPVSLPGEADEWVKDSPRYGVAVGALKPRMGDPDKGEPRDSVIFEMRAGADQYDLEVPRSNIACIRRAAPEKPAAPAGAKK